VKSIEPLYISLKFNEVVIDDEVDQVIKQTCIEISKRYPINFIEIGTDKDHIHFLVQSVPKYSPSQVVRIIKSITAREVFSQCPQVKKKLWGGEFWSDGYYVATVSEHGNENVIATYVKYQGDVYNKLYQGEQVEGQISLSEYM
jgi:putative transposase